MIEDSKVGTSKWSGNLYIYIYIYIYKQRENEMYLIYEILVRRDFVNKSLLKGFVDLGMFINAYTFKRRKQINIDLGFSKRFSIIPVIFRPISRKAKDHI